MPRRALLPLTIRRFGTEVGESTSERRGTSPARNSESVCTGRVMPKTVSTFAPPRSASTTTTRWPRPASATARLVVTIDLPTPPLPPPTAQMQGPFWVESSGRITGASWSSSRSSSRDSAVSRTVSSRSSSLGSTMIHLPGDGECLRLVKGDALAKTPARGPAGRAQLAAQRRGAPGGSDLPGGGQAREGAGRDRGAGLDLERAPELLPGLRPPPERLEHEAELLAQRRGVRAERHRALARGLGLGGAGEVEPQLAERREGVGVIGIPAERALEGLLGGDE